MKQSVEYTSMYTFRLGVYCTYMFLEEAVSEVPVYPIRGFNSYIPLSTTDNTTSGPAAGYQY